MIDIGIFRRKKAPNDTEISNLLKLATAQAGDKDYDSAIKTLRRSYSLMEKASTEWPINTYFRLARYLHLSGKYREAVDWLQKLHDNVDSASDAREALYREWGLIQSGNKPAKISKSLRNNKRRMIKREIEICMERQRIIEKNT